jgi:hypothetical protein
MRTEIAALKDQLRSTELSLSAEREEGQVISAEREQLREQCVRMQGELSDAALALEKEREKCECASKRACLGWCGAEEVNV